jgi:hypothetical protein
VKNVHDTHLNGKKKLGLVVHTCHPSDSRKPKIRGSQSRPTWAKGERPYLQNNESKTGWLLGSRGRASALQSTRPKVQTPAWKAKKKTKRNKLKELLTTKERSPSKMT